MAAKTKNKIIEVLMSRDNLSYDEAKDQLDYVRTLIDDAVAAGDYSEVEDIMYCELGLEMDYIFDII